MSANDSAFPVIESEASGLRGHDAEYPSDVVSRVYSTGGLTKREYFAVHLAFQRPKLSMEECRELQLPPYPLNQGPTARAEWHLAIEMALRLRNADALLAELAKGTT